jgi:hypothetical protein
MEAHMQIPSRRARGTTVAIGLGAVLAAALLAPANGASHREAPLISQDPVADNTDTYAFVSPDDPNKVTLIANYIPLQDPFGGPNYFAFGDDVLYEINIDNNGDAIPDITYEYRFTTANEVPFIPLYAQAPISSLEDPYNRKQTYSLTVVKDGRRTELGTGLPVPPVNVGPRTTPDYPSLAAEAVVEVGGLQSFAGQRDEAFAVDLGSIFDLGGLRPFNPAHLIPLPEREGVNATIGKNVHSLAIEVPIADVVQSSDQPVIAVWATASRQKVRVFAQNSGANPVNRGRWVQVSRLGNPLVNEVVIPISLKDVFNNLKPNQDADVLAGLEVPPYATEGAIPLVTDPILGELLEVLYPNVVDTPEAPRDDLVAIFLTGIKGLNQQPGGVPAEMLRLNTSIKPDAATFNPLGVIAGDNQGFPNGRRLVDDVIDISLRAVAGGTPLTPEFNKAPNNELRDGASGNDVPFLDTFPYIATPHAGYDTGPLQPNIYGDAGQ